MRFFEQVRDKSYLVVVSGVTLEELSAAPESVRRVLAELGESCVERVTVTAESEALARRYLEAKVVGRPA